MRKFCLGYGNVLDVEEFVEPFRTFANAVRPGTTSSASSSAHAAWLNRKAARVEC